MPHRTVVACRRWHPCASSPTQAGPEGRPAVCLHVLNWIVQQQGRRWPAEYEMDSSFPTWQKNKEIGFSTGTSCTCPLYGNLSKHSTGKFEIYFKYCSKIDMFQKLKENKQCNSYRMHDMMSLHTGLLEMSHDATKKRLFFSFFLSNHYLVKKIKLQERYSRYLLVPMKF